MWGLELERFIPILPNELHLNCGSGFRVEGVGFGVWGLGFGVSGFGMRDEGTGYTV